MMKQLTVPYEEIENRLAICCEFLLDRKKSIEDAYESLMEKLGTKLMEYTEFEYWFKRFQNNQFDLGYDTSLDEDTVVGIPDGAQIANEARFREQQWAQAEAPVEMVERKVNDLKLNHQFNESDVPQIFQTLINSRMTGLRSVSLDLNDFFSWLKFGDLHLCFKKKTDNWTVTYNSGSFDAKKYQPVSTTIETADPEKSIIYHLWFVLKNPNIELGTLRFKNEDSETKNRNSQKIDSERLNNLFQSMIDSIDHQFDVKRFECVGYNEDTFLSMLKHLKPKTLRKISFDISWKEAGNYQKLREIMRTSQWKQANRIFSLGVTPLKVEHLFQYKGVRLEVDSVTPKDVLCVTKVNQFARMTNQSTVPHTEVSLRLTILSEFLFDEEKSVKELYKSWTKRIGGRIIDFAKFEYWCRRFKNNQFDLGYDTSLDEKKIPEIQDTIVPEDSGKKDVSTMTVEVKGNMDDLKLDHQFEKENVPQVLQTHGENAGFEIPSGAQIVDDNRSETSNVSNEITIDPGYGTTQESKEVSEVQNTMVPEARGDEGAPTKIIETEVPVEIVQKKMENLKLNHEFNEENVPQIIQTIINDRINGLGKVSLNLNDSLEHWLKFDDFRFRFERKTDNWTVFYSWRDTTKNVHFGTKTETADREKFIVDHLWFVLKNSNIKLNKLKIKNEDPEAESRNSQKPDAEKIKALLQLMLDSIGHQFHAKLFKCEGYDEDMFLSMLKHVKPVTLEEIKFNISWKEDGNYQKMREIVETEQWKLAKKIDSSGVTSLKIDDLFQCEQFQLEVDCITTEDVLRATEHFFYSLDNKYCTLISRNEVMDIDAIKNVLRSQRFEINDYSFLGRFELRIVKSTKCFILYGFEDRITIRELQDYLLEFW